MTTDPAYTEVDPATLKVGDRILTPVLIQTVTSIVDGGVDPYTQRPVVLIGTDRTDRGDTGPWQYGRAGTVTARLVEKAP